MRTVSFLCAVLILLLASSAAIAAGGGTPVTVMIDGKPVGFEDVEPFIDEHDRTQVPVRFVSEELGAEVGWEPETGTVIIEDAERTVRFFVGETKYTVNGEEKEMDTTARIVDPGRTVVPPRFVADALGLDIGWHPETRTVALETEEEALPAEIKEWIEYSRELWIVQAREYRGSLYLLATYGEQPTGGYHVEITDVTEEEDQLTVTVSFSEPDEEEEVTPAVTYPYDLKKVEPTDLPVEFAREKEGVYLPKLHGLDWLPPMVAGEEDIRIFDPASGDKVSRELNVEGVANIYEAAFNYRILDSEGGELKSGRSSAYGLGWGYLELKLQVPEEVESGEEFLVELYSVSPVDGSVVNLVELELVLEEDAPPAQFRGNTPGNLVNRGLAVKHDGWVYFQSNDNGALYRSKLDGSQPQKLTGDTPRYLNAAGGWIYYTNMYDNHRIYRIKNDGSERTRLSQNSAQDMVLANGWIYYSNRDDGEKIYRMTPDGQEKQRLNQNPSRYLNVEDVWIFYCRVDEENDIYRIRTDGTGRSKVHTEDIHGITHLNVVEDHIYFCWVSRGIHGGTKIYRINTDGSERTKISYDHSRSINVQEDQIFYPNFHDEYYLYRLHLEKEEQTGSAVNQDRSKYPNVVGDWIYYRNEDDGRMYRISTEGINRDKLPSEIVTDVEGIYIGGVDAHSVAIEVEGEEKLFVIEKGFQTGDFRTGDPVILDYYQQIRPVLSRLEAR